MSPNGFIGEVPRGKKKEPSRFEQFMQAVSTGGMGYLKGIAEQRKLAEERAQKLKDIEAEAGLKFLLAQAEQEARMRQMQEQQRLQTERAYGVEELRGGERAGARLRAAQEKAAKLGGVITTKPTLPIAEQAETAERLYRERLATMPPTTKAGQYYIFPSIGEIERQVWYNPQSYNIVPVTDERGGIGYQARPRQAAGGVSLFETIPSPTPIPTGFRENETATNPQTGERIIFRNGQWQPLR